MLCVTVEIREYAVTRRVRIIAPSIEQAIKVAGAGKPGRRARLLFPIDPDTFLLPEGSERREVA